jgi:hypothetical protein
MKSWLADTFPALSSLLDYLTVSRIIVLAIIVVSNLVYSLADQFNTSSCLYNGSAKAFTEFTSTV